MRTIKGLYRVLFSFILAGILCFVAPFSLFSQSVEEDEEREDYLEVIAEFFRQEDWDSAKEWLDKSIKKYPRDSDLRLQMGKYYFEKNGMIKPVMN